MSHEKLKEEFSDKEEEEKGNVAAPLEVSTTVTKKKHIVSRIFNIFLAIGFFVVFAMSMVSFSASSNSYRKISGTDQGGLGSACALNANPKDETLGKDGACQFAIGGQVVICLYCILSMVVMVIKIVGGWKIISCFLIFELISAVVITLLSFANSVVISVGLSLTCRRIDDNRRCADNTLYGKGFYTDFEIAQASAWLGFGVIVLILVFYCICVIMYCYGRRQAKKARNSQYSGAI